ncbi:cupin domain-containing protein [Streptomyces sp. NPDC059788]|uniref:cupin domain-containing protein n=1 Tax=Streptomyces sp. NPDC059788 TaxID=3346948 RepID=UPI00365D2E54
MADTSKVINSSDIAPNRNRGGEIRVTLSQRTVGATSGFGGSLRLEPGDYVSEHYHPYSEEFVHVIQGDLELRVEGEPFPLGPDDSFLVPIGQRHRLANVGDSTAHVIFHLSPLAPRPDLGHVDTEPLPSAGDR